MSPSQYITPLARILLQGPIVLDAGWSLFEGTVLSRKKFGLFGKDFLKTYLIDFFASHFSDLIFLESKKQKTFYTRLFLVRKSKVKVLYTGVDEKAFIGNTQERYLEYQDKKLVSFRGKYNREAGIEVLAQATRILAESPYFFAIYCPGIPSELKFGPNVYVDSDLHSKEDFAALQKASFLTLGQMARNGRLDRTIPHKAFEAAFMGTPYLTGRNSGILEIFREDVDISCFIPGDAVDLAQKIDYLCGHPALTQELGRQMNLRYKVNLSQNKLGEAFLKFVNEISVGKL
jgi:glycosyltransferase involved in cell wall biosynthesis